MNTAANMPVKGRGEQLEFIKIPTLPKIYDTGSLPRFQK